jgi:Peptidase propeptide and YPEB domain
MKTPFKTSAIALLSTSGLLVAMGAAVAAVSVGDKLGTTEDDIRAALTGQGYTVEEFESEDGKLEAEVTMDGQEMEVVVDAQSGLVLELELEDGEKDEKDDD